MSFNVWFPVFTLILGQALVIGAKWLETKWQRRQSGNDRERATLVELQDALDDLLRRAWEADVFVQEHKPVPAELSAEHRIAAGRVRRLATRVPDEQTRAMIEEVQKGFGRVIQQSYQPGDDSPFKAQLTLIGLDQHLDALYERMGERIRAL